jgi:putative (di)nucleoside polyphosphate hydrolase
MPQGGIQGTELSHHAALRELKEEIGTDNVQIIDRLPGKLRYEFPDWLQYRQGVFRGKYRGQEQEWFALRYLGCDGDIDLSGEHEPEAPEFVAWKWTPLIETPSLVVDFKREVYSHLVRSFDKYSVLIRNGNVPDIWLPTV